MDDLKVIRDKWLECYRSGDIKGLMKYESDTLTVMSDGITDSKDRYKKIQESVNSKSWLQPKMKTVVTYAEKELQTAVTGYCEILNGKHAGLILQIHELWNNEGGKWKLEHLSINA